jgi:lipoprotein-anchoring transpeptidase ErfK/SrfK
LTTAAAVLVAMPLLAWTAPAQAAQAQPQPITQTADAGHRSLHPGDHGNDVRDLQTRLKAMHYDPGAVTGKYGNDTVPAVWAFQKVNHISPSSTVGPATWKALAHPVVPTPLIPKGERSRVEVDIKHQLMYVYRKGSLVLISHISTGSGQLYKVRGHWERAITPTGNFRVERRIKGWHQSDLGYLYNPLYFHNGFAIHGEGEVPLYPASHGCVRIPLHTADIVPVLVSNGTAVYLRR